MTGNPEELIKKSMQRAFMHRAFGILGLSVIILMGLAAGSTTGAPVKTHVL